MDVVLNSLFRFLFRIYLSTKCTVYGHELSVVITIASIRLLVTKLRTDLKDTCNPEEITVKNISSHLSQSFITLVYFDFNGTNEKESMIKVGNIIMILPWE